jgi:hypothetical protein
MSTKIYDAYKWSGTSMEELLSKLKTMRDLYLEYIAARIVPWSKNSEFIAFMDLIQDETTKGLNSPLNIEASVVVYPFNSEIYIQFFGVPKLVFTPIFGDSISDYHYQDQSDQPEDISDGDWEARKELWDKILDWNAPSVSGFSYTLCNEYDSYNVASRVRELGGTKKDDNVQSMG